LSLDRPRRIFRPAVAPVRPRGVGLVLLAAAVGAAAWAIAALPSRSTVAPHARAGTDTVAAQPAQVAVVDAGTLLVQDHVVRLLGVAPPARGVTCRSPDGAGFDCGAAASNALASLVRETPVACRLSGQDEQGRAYAVCEASGTELNRAVIAAGWARADSTEPSLKRDEDVARTEHRGLWAMREPSW
jgi:endonuclease YncB( thermonuclease family)